MPETTKTEIEVRGSGGGVGRPMADIFRTYGGRRHLVNIIQISADDPRLLDSLPPQTGHLVYLNPEDDDA